MASVEIKDDEAHNRACGRASILMSTQARTPEEDKELSDLVDAIGAYEKVRWPMVCWPLI